MATRDDYVNACGSVEKAVEFEERVISAITFDQIPEAARSDPYDDEPPEAYWDFLISQIQEEDLVDDEQIAAARRKAIEAGDTDMAILCDQALYEFVYVDEAITRVGRDVDGAYRKCGETDEGVIDSGVHLGVGEAAKFVGVDGTWDSETLTWTSDSWSTARSIGARDRCVRAILDKKEP